MLFLFIALSTHLEPLNVPLNFSVFEAVENPTINRGKTCIRLRREMSESLQCSLI